MTALHRHQLAWLAPDGWRRILEHERDAMARACLEHWAAHHLPLVVTQQPCEVDAIHGAIAMGLPAPGRWERRRIALRVAPGDVLRVDEFPRADAVTPLLSAVARAAWQRLCTQLDACDAIARVYGSYGWQAITGLDHLRSGSDIDLWIAVSHAARADAVAAVLQGFTCERLRLDGELVFEDHTAVAWREWAAWRAGNTRSLLVKSLTGTSLSQSPDARQRGARASS
jgi:phosphoribosyl-dephospho-CoA transferase